MAFPSTIDTFAKPNPTDPRTNPSAANLVSSIATTLEAVQTKLGVDGSSVTTSIDYLLKNTTGGHSHDGTNSRKVSYSDLLGIPSTFPPSSHPHSSHTGIGPDDHHPDVHPVTKHQFRGALGLRNTNQNLTNGVETVLGIQTKAFDTSSLISTSANQIQFSTLGAGYYRISARIWITVGSGTDRRYAYIRLNGTDSLDRWNRASASGDVAHLLTYVGYFNASDYVDIIVRSNNTGDSISSANTWVFVEYLGA